MRTITIEVLIVGAIDLFHPTRADFLKETVVAEHPTNNEIGVDDRHVHRRSRPLFKLAEIRNIRSDR